MKLSFLKKVQFSDVFKMYISSVFSRLFGFLGGIITAKILGPTFQGISKSVEIIQSYYPLTSLGTINGISRNLAFYLGQNNHKKAVTSINTTFSSLFTLPLIVSIGCIAYPLLVNTDHLTSVIYQTTGIVTFATILANLNIRILNARLNFNTSAKVSLISSLVSTIISIVFVYFFNIEGRFWGNMLSVLLSVLISSLFIQHRFKFKIDKNELKSLLSIGAPIMLVGMMYVLILGIDRWIILFFFSFSQLGFYSIALTFSKLVGDACDALTEVIYQRINRKYGETGDARDLYAIIIRPVYLLSISFPILIIILIIWIPFIINLLLPKYLPGVRSAQIYIWGTFFYGISVNVLNTINKRKIYLSLQLIMFIINILFGYLLAQAYGIAGVAFATAASFVVYSVLLTIVSLKLMEKNNIDVFKVVMNIYLPSLYVGTGMLIMGFVENRTYFFNDNLFLKCVAESVFIIIFYSPLFPAIIRRIKNKVDI